MNRDKSNKIIINKLNSDLSDFSQKKFDINLNRVAFIFLVILIFVILYSTRVVYLSSKTLIVLQQLKLIKDSVKS